ncbi:MAG: class I SAM-dependent methyltransferase [Chitinophagaceae bacterium]|jgi:2-polyprenyl-3-methyl-5-hydroxy-6-metoxy-1,4-benzoquinol methylase|nr:class I SAM-dependent methyltransferase [Chitinophagaceae bacterium]
MNSSTPPSLCPVCSADNLRFAFNCKDHSISGETFSLWDCLNCTLRFTYPVPEEKFIGPYYKAEHYISHTDTSKGLINKLYRIARRFTLSEKRRFVQRQTNLASGKLLDVGTGIGAFLHEMESSGWQTIGTEPEFEARNNAYKLFKLKVYEPSQLFEFSHQSFDAITLWHVLEHIYNLEGYMQQFAKLLKPKGLLFIAVPNFKSYDAGFYKDYWAAYDVPRHLYHFSPASMQVLASRNGFRIIKRKAMWLDSFYISLLSEQYKHGRSRYISGFMRGSISFLNAVFSRTRCSSLIYVLKKD